MTNGLTFLHLNDNIPSLGQAKKLASKYQNIDVLALVASAASSYPHCFDNLSIKEKKAEKARIVEKIRSRFFKITEIFSAKAAIPCGNYILNGALADLDQYVPNLQNGFFEEGNKNQIGNSQIVSLMPMSTVTLDSTGLTFGEEKYVFEDRKQALKTARARALDHELICLPESFSPPWKRYFYKARKNLWTAQERLNLYPDWVVKISPMELGKTYESNALNDAFDNFIFDLKVSDATIPDT